MRKESKEGREKCDLVFVDARKNVLLGLGVGLFYDVYTYIPRMNDV